MAAFGPGIHVWSMPLFAALRRTMDLLALACQVVCLGAACTATTGTEDAAQRVHALAADVAVAPLSANPLATLSPPSNASFAAIVDERLEAGSYTYMAVRTSDQRTRWIVTMGPGEAAGRSVRVKSMGERAEFHSPRLDRTFSPLTFATVEPIE